MQRSMDERVIPPFSASSVLDGLGEALTTIRREDKLTFGDIAAVLGVSEDQAARYCAGSATMNAVTFFRGKREWNGRFTGAADRLCEHHRNGHGRDRARGSAVLKAALALSVALEDDEEITPDEVRANRATIEQARDALDELLRKLSPKIAPGAAK